MPRSSQPTYVFSGGSGEDVPARTLRQVKQLLPVKIWQGVPSDVPVEVVDIGRPYIGPDAAAYHFKSQRSPTLVAVPVGYKTHAAIRGCSFAFSTGIGPAGPVYHAQRRLRPDEPDADRHAGYAAASVQLQWTCSSPSELLVVAAAHVAQIAHGEEASQLRFSAPALFGWAPAHLQLVAVVNALCEPQLALAAAGGLAAVSGFSAPAARACSASTGSRALSRLGMAGPPAAPASQAAAPRSQRRCRVAQHTLVGMQCSSPQPLAETQQAAPSPAATPLHQGCAVQRIALETPAVPQPLQPATWAEVASPPAARPTASAARPTAAGTSAAGAAPAFPAAAHTPPATSLPAPSACMAASARASAATAAAGADGTAAPTSLSAPLFVDLLRAARMAEPWLAGWTSLSTGATLQLVALSGGEAGQPSVVRLILELDPDGAWVVHALRRRVSRAEVHELARMPRLLSQLAAVKIVLLALEELQLCPGNNDESAFEALMGSRRDGALYQRGSGGGATARVETEPFDCWYGRVTWTVRAQALPAASSATDGGSQAADGGGQAADGGGGAAEGGSPAVGGGNQATGNGGQATDSSSQAADIGGHAASGCGLLVRSGGRCEACRRVRSHLRMAVSREHASEANPLQAAYGRHLNNLSHDVLMAENSHLTRECEALRKRKALLDGR